MPTKPDPTTECACEEYWPGQGHHPECPTQRGKPTPTAEEKRQPTIDEIAASWIYHHIVEHDLPSEELVRELALMLSSREDAAAKAAREEIKKVVEPFTVCVWDGSSRGRCGDELALNDPRGICVACKLAAAIRTLGVEEGE